MPKTKKRTKPRFKKGDRVIDKTGIAPKGTVTGSRIKYKSWQGIKSSYIRVRWDDGVSEDYLVSYLKKTK